MLPSSEPVPIRVLGARDVAELLPIGDCIAAVEVIRVCGDLRSSELRSALLALSEHEREVTLIPARHDEMHVVDRYDHDPSRRQELRPAHNEHDGGAGRFEDEAG